MSARLPPSEPGKSKDASLSARPGTAPSRPGAPRALNLSDSRTAFGTPPLEPRFCGNLPDKPPGTPGPKAPQAIQRAERTSSASRASSAGHGDPVRHRRLRPRRGNRELRLRGPRAGHHPFRREQERGPPGGAPGHSPPPAHHAAHASHRAGRPPPRALRARPHRTSRCGVGARPRRAHPSRPRLRPGDARPAAHHPNLQRFRREYPHLELHLDVNDQVADIVGDGLDAAVRCGELTGSCAADWAQALHPLRLSRLPPAHGTPRSLDARQEHDCIRYRFVSTGRVESWALRQPAGAPSPRIPETFVFNTSDAVTHAARAGFGIAQFVELMIRPELDAGTLRPFLREHSLERGALWRV
nr:LysR substrate-binding domain-containing protein [Corallococcus exiguus]